MEKKRITVLGKEMAYLEAGEGDPIVFVHGNPTSSYMWRGVLPLCQGSGRCIALDLIGMGDSKKILEGGPERYSVSEQSRYFDALLDQLEVKDKVTFVVHSWGGVLASHWAVRNRDAMKGYCFMESPLSHFPTWESVPEHLRGGFQAMRTEQGEKLILEMNMMIERGIQSGCERELSAAELDEYRRPFLEAGEGRRPILSFVRSVPVEGEPADVCEMMNSATEWLGVAPLPKLLVLGDPGSSMTADEIASIRSWPGLTEVTVKGKHLLPEDSPDEIGKAISEWYQLL